MSLALIWGIVCSCRTNMTRDMIKNLKIWFFKTVKFCNFLIFCLSIFFRFIIISLAIFNLQGYTIPQIKAKDISFGPYSFKFLAKINIFWDRKQWICLMIFWPRLYECKKMQNCTFFEKSYFQLFNHIFCHIWPTGECYNSN